MPLTANSAVRGLSVAAAVDILKRSGLAGIAKIPHEQKYRPSNDWKVKSEMSGVVRRTSSGGIAQC
jgi:hypothetical protein